MFNLGILRTLQQLTGATNTDRFKVIEIAIGENIQTWRQALCLGLSFVCRPIDLMVIGDQEITGIVAIGRLGGEKLDDLCGATVLQRLQA